MPQTSSLPRPWRWVPTLYFAEGLPYVAVMSIAVILYKRLGLGNAAIALYTSWLYLPWIIKPLWSPLVDLVRTKRWWVVGMQTLIAAALAGVAFFLPTAFAVRASLACFWLMAFASATHDIAADGFYMLALDSGSQALFIGIRNTFYRLATIFGQGVLVMLAGWLEQTRGDVVLAWSLTFYAMAALFLGLMLWHRAVLPRPSDDRVGASETTSSQGKPADSGKHVAHAGPGNQDPLCPSTSLDDGAESHAGPGSQGHLCPSTSLDDGAGRAEGCPVRENTPTRARPASISTTAPARPHRAIALLRSFLQTFASFFLKRQAPLMLFFLLTYRLGEAQLAKLASPFLLDTHEAGGLGMGTATVGMVYGTIGVIALLAGGIVGGVLVSRHGFRRWILPMALAINLPDLLYVWLAATLPLQTWAIALCVAVEQLGYGFGFTAYTLCLILMADGPCKTAHYAIGTGIMAIGMMLPGMFAGMLQERMGYPLFFLWACLCTLPGIVASLLVRRGLDPAFGRRAA